MGNRERNATRFVLTEENDEFLTDSGWNRCSVDVNNWRIGEIRARKSWIDIGGRRFYESPKFRRRDTGQADVI